MPTWPASLPQEPLAGGLTVADDDAVLRTQMDAGPPTRRNRFTAITQSVTVGMVLSGTEKQAFDTFYRTTLKHGALSFDWIDQVTGSAVAYAFKKPPEFSLVAPADDPADREWQGTLQLEIQP